MGHKTSSRKSVLGFLVWCSTLYNTAEVSQEVGGPINRQVLPTAEPSWHLGDSVEILHFLFLGFFFHLFPKKNVFYLVSSRDQVSLVQASPSSALLLPGPESTHMCYHIQFFCGFLFILVTICMKRGAGIGTSLRKGDYMYKSKNI